MKRIIMGGLLAAATLLGGLALTSNDVSAAGDTITVDGNVYQQSFDNNGTVHFDTPGAATVSSASTTANGGQTWDGVNGAGELPCTGGIHWVSNASRLVISHCNDVPPPPVCDEGEVGEYPDCEPPCEYDETIPADDEGCGPPPPPVCDEGEVGEYPDCEPPCEYDETSPADDEGCVPPPPMVTYSEWGDGTFECDDTSVEQTRTKTTTPYVYDDGEWVLDSESAVEATETRTRQLTAGEITACPTPPPANPPAEIQVAVEFAARVAAAPPAAAVSAVPTELPATGNSSWVTALIALVALAGGTGLVRLSRRPTD